MYMFATMLYGSIWNSTSKKHENYADDSHGLFDYPERPSKPDDTDSGQ